MSSTSNIVVPFGQGYIVVRSRQRITLDGGTSLLAVPKGPQIHQSDLGEISTANKTNARSAVGGCSDTGYSSSSSGIEESQYHATAPVVTDPTPTLSDEALWYGMREPGFVEYDWGAGQSTIIFLRLLGVLIIMQWSSRREATLARSIASESWSIRREATLSRSCTFEYWSFTLHALGTSPKPSSGSRTFITYLVGLRPADEEVFAPACLPQWTASGISPRCQEGEDCRP